MELAGQHNLTIQRNAVFGFTMEYYDGDNNAVDLTGATAKMQIRRTADDHDVLNELSTANGQITIDPDERTVTVLMDEGVRAQSRGSTPSMTCSCTAKLVIGDKPTLRAGDQPDIQEGASIACRQIGGAASAGSAHRQVRPCAGAVEARRSGA